MIRRGLKRRGGLSVSIWVKGSSAHLCLKTDAPSPLEWSAGGKRDAVEWPTPSVKDRATWRGFPLAFFPTRVELPYCRMTSLTLEWSWSGRSSCQWCNVSLPWKERKGSIRRRCLVLVSSSIRGGSGVQWRWPMALVFWDTNPVA